jgi:uncharacterized Zn finger protein (UPF0148 family)
METITVTCPCCQTILIVERRSGKVVEQRKPILEESTGDRFEDAFLKVKKQKEILEEKFLKARQKESEKKEKLEKLFKESLQRAQEEGPPEKPQKPIDFD